MKDKLGGPVVANQEMWLDLVAQVKLEGTCTYLYTCNA